MNDERVLEQLSQTDVYPSDAEMPATAWSRNTALREIERRVGMGLGASTDEAIETAALLDTDERRRTMQTQQTETPVARPQRDRKRLVAVGAAFAVVVAVAGVALWIAAAGDDTDNAPSATDVTQPVVTEPPVGEATITFDEETLSCSYTGPTTFLENQQVVFTAVNNSEIPVDFAVVAVPSADVVPLWTPSRSGDPRLTVAGTEVFLRDDAVDRTFERLRIGVLERVVPDHLGTWILACFSADESPRFFYDRTTTFEVVPAG